VAGLVTAQKRGTNNWPAAVPGALEVPRGVLGSPAFDVAGQDVVGRATRPAADTVQEGKLLDTWCG